MAEQKTSGSASLIQLSIVGIVAVVGILVLFQGGFPSGNIGDVVGQAGGPEDDPYFFYRDQPYNYFSSTESKYCEYERWNAKDLIYNLNRKREEAKSRATSGQESQIDSDFDRLGQSLGDYLYSKGPLQRQRTVEFDMCFDYGTTYGSPPQLPDDRRETFLGAGVKITR